MATDRVASRPSDRFYNELAPFHDFAAFVEFDAYEPVPDDWVVMISDVQGSTRAIEEGRYKDVNMVGAASITAVLNICGDIAVPFVFGGDGGTLVVPGSLRDAAGAALAGLRAMSQATFGPALRVGAIPVADLRATGADLRVRKYQLMADNYLAMFAGGGAELADSLLKSAEPGSRYLLEAEPEGGPNLEGLSCRWEPLVPRSGRMMTIMVQATTSDPAGEGDVLDDVVREITTVLGHGLQQSAPATAHPAMREPAGEADLLGDVVREISEILGHRRQESAPASDHSMTFKWPPRGLALEARATAGRGTFLWRYLEVLVSSLIQSWL